MITESRRDPLTPPRKPQARNTWIGPTHKMAFEAQYGGPLDHTLIERWRDPGEGTICYLYLPTASPSTGNGASELSCLGPMPPPSPGPTGFALAE